MIQVYTGNGKGKTTAALGLALRALGAGKRVLLCQFLKAGNYCELISLKRFKEIEVEQYGRSSFIRNAPEDKDRKLAYAGLKAVRKAIASRRYSMVILDEVNVALNLKLIGLKDLLSIMNGAPKEIELVITGRNAHPQVIKCADLVSRINEVKHYYKAGQKARKGIEL
ncbi:MAG: cob(I)yrinic acid a,c-diamide adenosyltransferase [Candidatus Omnitrophota bacterium]